MNNKFDVQIVRNDFPLISSIENKNFLYLDNAATAQKPKCVIDALASFYSKNNANIHRGLYRLSQISTAAYEKSRSIVAEFINATFPQECIFTKGTTESMNLICSSWGMDNVKEGDEIILTEMEHHANIVPWQHIAEVKRAKLKVVPILENGDLDMKQFEKLLSPKTKVVSVAHVSNVLGTINPIKEIIKGAHSVGAICVIDGAQGAAHLSVDVKDLDCDFYVFSGHKLCGPTGIGVLYGKLEFLENMSPYQMGGDMIEKVSFAKTTFRSAPGRFEAGTPNIAGAIGLAEALKYLMGLRPLVFEYEKELAGYAKKSLESVPGLMLWSQAKHFTPVFSFNLEGIHSGDLGMLLDSYNVAIRVGHHCAMPLMEALGVSGTARASFSFYNTFEEVDLFVDALLKIKKMF